MVPQSHTERAPRSALGTPPDQTIPPTPDPQTTTRPSRTPRTRNRIRFHGPERSCGTDAFVLL